MHRLISCVHRLVHHKLKCLKAAEGQAKEPGGLTEQGTPAVPVGASGAEVGAIQAAQAACFNLSGRTEAAAPTSVAMPDACTAARCGMSAEDDDRASIPMPTASAFTAMLHIQMAAAGGARGMQPYRTAHQHAAAAMQQPPKGQMPSGCHPSLQPPAAADSTKPSLATLNNIPTASVSQAAAVPEGTCGGGIDQAPMALCNDAGMLPSVPPASPLQPAMMTFHPVPAVAVGKRETASKQIRATKSSEPRTYASLASPCYRASQPCVWSETLRTSWSLPRRCSSAQHRPANTRARALQYAQLWAQRSMTLPHRGPPLSNRSRQGSYSALSSPRRELVSSILPSDASRGNTSSRPQQRNDAYAGLIVRNGSAQHRGYSAAAAAKALPDVTKSSKTLLASESPDGNRLFNSPHRNVVTATCNSLPSSPQKTSSGTRATVQLASSRADKATTCCSPCSPYNNQLASCAGAGLSSAGLVAVAGPESPTAKIPAGFSKPVMQSKVKTGDMLPASMGTTINNGINVCGAVTGDDKHCWQPHHNRVHNSAASAVRPRSAAAAAEQSLRKRRETYCLRKPKVPAQPSHRGPVQLSRQLEDSACMHVPETIATANASDAAEATTMAASLPACNTNVDHGQPLQTTTGASEFCTEAPLIDASTSSTIVPQQPGTIPQPGITAVGKQQGQATAQHAAQDRLRSCSMAGTCTNAAELPDHMRNQQAAEDDASKEQAAWLSKAILDVQSLLTQTEMHRHAAHARWQKAAHKAVESMITAECAMLSSQLLHSRQVQDMVQVAHTQPQEEFIHAQAPSL